MSTANQDERGEIEELLPWHAAGTLSPGESRRVEAALASDPELARHYELVREELAQTIHLNETLGAPSPRAMQALFAKIDAEPARRPAASLNIGARARGFFAGLSPRTLAWSATAAALAIVLQAGIIAGVMLREGSPAGYETASAPSRVAAGGSYALIRFRPDATAAAIAGFLETNRLDIAGGPLAGGLFRVRIATAKLPKADLARLIGTLEANPVVGFIAPAE